MNPIYQLQYSNNTLEGRKVRQCMIQTPKTCRKKIKTDLWNWTHPVVLALCLEDADGLDALHPHRLHPPPRLLPLSTGVRECRPGGHADLTLYSLHSYQQQLCHHPGTSEINNFTPLLDRLASRTVLWNIDTLQVKTWDGRPPGVGGRRHLVRHWPDRKMDVQQEFIDFWVGQAVL